jgi:hypothetical protein
VRKAARRIPIFWTPLTALVLDRRVNEGTIDPANPWQVRNNGGQADELRLIRSRGGRELSECIFHICFARHGDPPEVAISHSKQIILPLTQNEVHIVTR